MRPPLPVPNIHPTAIVSDSAKLADDVTIGAHTIIDGPVTIGAGCKIGAQAWITGKTVLGENNTVGHGTIIGSDPQAHPFDASIDTGVILGSNNLLREYITINRATAPGTNTTVGHDNFLMIGAHLGHDVVVGDHNIIGNNALIGGHVIIGNKVVLGGGAGCHQFIHVGDYAMLAGNATIVYDTPPYCMATREEKLAGLNTIGLRRAGFTPDERMEIKRLYRILFRSDDNRDEILAEAAKTEWSEHAAKLLAAFTNPSKRGILSH